MVANWDDLLTSKMCVVSPLWATQLPAPEIGGPLPRSSVSLSYLRTLRLPLSGQPLSLKYLLPSHLFS